MRIQGKTPEVTQPKPSSNVQPTTQPSSQSPAVSSEQAAPRRERNDQVQISDAGRTKAAQATSTGGLDPQRASDIRRKVLEGAYNSVQVVDNVARKILDRGDV